MTIPICVAAVSDIVGDSDPLVPLASGVAAQTTQPAASAATAEVAASRANQDRTTQDRATQDKEQWSEGFGRATSYRAALAQVLGEADWAYGDRRIDVHIARIRQKLESRSDGGFRVRSARGRGYILDDNDD